MLHFHFFVTVNIKYMNHLEYNLFEPASKTVKGNIGEVKLLYS